MKNISQEIVVLNNLLNAVTNAVNSIRYGNLSHRLDSAKFCNKPEFIQDFNNMIESIEDREFMIKEYQAQLNNQKDYLEALFNSMNDGILTISADCKIIRVNNKMLEWLKLKEIEVIGSKIQDLFETDCKIDCQNCDIESLFCSIISHNTNTGSTIVKIKNTNLTFSVNSSKFLDRDGCPNFVLVFRDITKELEVEELRKNFIATLTHDLRVPILAESNTIKLFLKNAFGTCTNKQEEALNNMLESNRELITLVNSLLDTYKFEEGSYILFKEVFDLNSLVEEVFEEFRYIIEKNEQNLVFKPKNKNTPVHADRKEIKRVLRNLIDNSIIYSPKGGIIQVDVSKKGKFLSIKITDNGKGIPTEDINRIFERYYSSAKKFRKIGTGLGLFLSKQIVENHGGEIFVKSEPGVVTIFTFTLPLE